MMDISAQIEIPVAAEPLQPWLRLAHLSNAPRHYQPRGNHRRILDYELVFQVSGTMWWWWAATGCSQALPAGWCAFIPPGIEHAYGYGSGQHIAVHFDLHHVPGLTHPRMIEPAGQAVDRDDGDALPWFRLIRSPGDSLLIPALQAVDAASWERRLSRIVELVQTLGAASLRTQREAGAILLGLLGELDHAAEADGGADARIMQAIAEVPITGKPAIAALAARCGMSENAFRGAFRRTTGELPHRFFEARRIEAALRLLRETSLSIAAVAEATGYDDPFHFSRACKRVSGRAPSAWRQ